MNKFQSLINQKTKRTISNMEHLNNFLLRPKHDKSYYKTRKFLRKFYKKMWYIDTDNVKDI